MAEFNEISATAQTLIDKAITAAVCAHTHKEHKLYKLMNQSLGEKDAYIRAAQIVDGTDETYYGVYCDRFIARHGVAMFEKMA